MAYDAIVVGLGGMGSAALAEIAERGASVLGIEQFDLGHELGASSGQSRIIRKAYFEDQAYVPLVLRAYEKWRELERTSGVRMLHVTGTLIAGRDDSAIIEGTLSAARLHGLLVEELDAAEIRRRFPMFSPRAGERAVFEPEGGFVIPEAAVTAQLQRAKTAGADVRSRTRVLRWQRTSPRAIVVELEDGSRVEARRLALCAGPWIEDLAREPSFHVTVQRNIQHWFEPTTAAFSIDRCPTFFIDRAEQPRHLYGFPDYGLGVKAAFHEWGATTTADELDREVHESDIEPVRRVLDSWMPGAAGRHLRGKACMYSLSDDRHFVLGPHPNDSAVIIAGGFSGHGFKFAPVVGEIVANLALDGEPRHDIAFLSPARLATTGEAVR